MYKWSVREEKFQFSHRKIDAQCIQVGGMLGLCIFMGWKCINCSIITFSDENLCNKVACDVWYDLRALSHDAMNNLSQSIMLKLLFWLNKMRVCVCWVSTQQFLWRYMHKIMLFDLNSSNKIFIGQAGKFCR